MHLFLFTGKPRLACSATIVAPFISLILGVGIPASLLFLLESDLTHLSVQLSDQIFIMFLSVSLGLVLTALQLILNNFISWRPFGVFLILFYLVSIILDFTLEFKIWSFPVDYYNA